jgi:hypothetical protein
MTLLARDGGEVIVLEGLSHKKSRCPRAAASGVLSIEETQGKGLERHPTWGSMGRGGTFPRGIR